MRSLPGDCSKPVQKYAAFTGLLLLAGAAAGQPPTPAALPDLEVAYISLTPRYPAPTVREIDGVQRAVDPSTGQPLPAGAWERTQKWPRPGETITATARVLNRGTAPSGPFRYRWVLNRKEVGEGRHEGLAPGCRASEETRGVEIAGAQVPECELQPGTWVEISQPFKWKKGQTLRLEVRLEDPKAAELAPEPDPRSELSPRRDNNVLEERTDALSFLVAISRRAYNTWAELRAPGRHPGFEQWIQSQFDVVSGRLQASAYPSAPEGVEQPIRIDRILVLPDRQDSSLLAERRAAAGWDGFWMYDAPRRPSDDAAIAASDLDPALGRSLLRQLGVASLGRLTILPEQVRIGGEPVLAGFVQQEITLSDSTILPEHATLALNRLAGHRRGFRGTYLLDLPQAARLQVLDNNGRTLPDVEIAVYRKSGGEIDPKPIAAGVTNSAGTFPLPNRAVQPVRTDDGFELRPNPFGQVDPDGGNGLLLVSLRGRGFSEWQWLPITAFNLAHWRRQDREALFDLRTRIPSIAAPPPPSKLSAERAAVDGAGGIRLEWAAPAAREVGGYVIYRGEYPTYAWERIGAVTLLGRSYFDPSAGTHPVRYGVAAVDLDGNESGLAEITVPPR